MKKKKRGVNKHFIIIASLISVIFVLIIFTAVQMTGGNITLSKDFEENIEQLTPKDIDFPHAKGGTIEGWTSNNYYKDPIDEVIVFFASVTVPGLTIIYYPHEEKIIAGTPQMVAEGIKLFKGEKHRLAYTFKNGGKQSIKYDNKIIAESDFQLFGGELTGMVTGSPEAVISPSFEEVKIS